MINRQKLIKKYIAAMEKAITEALKNCDELNELMDTAQDEGFNINMNFMLVVGDNELGESEEIKPGSRSRRKSKLKSKPVITDEDLKFLDELGIKWNY